MILNEKQLNDMCSELMEMMWGEKLEVPVKINGKLKRTFGKFISYRLSLNEYKPSAVEISKSLLSGQYKLSTVESVIKHELCHYYLCKIGKEFSDGSYTFEKELKRIGAHSTRIIKSLDRKHECICETCKRVVARYTSEGKAKSTVKQCISGCCRSKLQYKLNDSLKDNSSEIQSEFTVINKYIVQAPEKTSRRTQKTNKEIICANKESNKSGLKIEDIVILKRKKVSQQNVWDAMLLAVEEKSPEKLKLIKQHYPDLFNKICLFIGKKRVEYINSVI